MNEDLMLPPPVTKTAKGMWVKIYVTTIGDESLADVTDRAGAQIEEFECYAHALEFVRYNGFKLKTVHRNDVNRETQTFLHLVGE
jgi:hypothetical protein